MATAASADTSGNDTRARILAAAATAVSRRGYSKTHLAEIARIAAVQPPAVYYYFDSREDLISAVMAEGQRLVRTHVTEALDALHPGAGARERVAAAVEAHLRVELELSEFATAVTRNAGQLPDHVRSGLDAGSEAFHDVWRTLLLGAAAEGELRAGLDLSVSRMLLVGALNWATEWWSSGIAIDRVVATAQQLVVAALFEPAQS